MNLLDQAMKLGAETQMAQVTGIRDEGEVKVIVTEKNIRAGVLFNRSDTRHLEYRMKRPDRAGVSIGGT